MIADTATALTNRLEGFAANSPDYWSFRGNARRDHGHGLMQYPAMMVPQMVRALLQEICSIEPAVHRVGDPFVGSGTVLTEAMLRGQDFVGRDINPLAILMCRVKAGPYFPKVLSKRSDEVLTRIAKDDSVSLAAEFETLDKWFAQKSQVNLSQIRRAVSAEPSAWARRFFWVAVADTVRLCSNSRTSTFKLHKRHLNDLAKREVDVKATFERVLRRNLVRLETLGKALQNGGHIKRGRYVGNVSLELGDARTPMLNTGTALCDAIITSPPYGDNRTTVPYGQYSYLPLQWIDLADIHSEIDEACLCTTHEIDRLSLGGSRRVVSGTVEDLKARSPHLSSTLDELSGEPPDRAQRIVAFVRDLDRCIPHALAMLRAGGIMVWVLGNRRVGGRPVPLDKILGDFLRERGAKRIIDVRRRIPSKRMAVRNSVAETMASETILVYRKGGTYDARTG